VSGYGDPNLTQQTLAAGVTALLAKPVQTRQIATTLARVLHRNAQPPAQAHPPARG
jgi:FixJ family two-component response regulator